MKGVYVFLADGFEDVEALATVDVLRRGGVDVKTVSIAEEPFVNSSHGVAVGADMTYDDLLEDACNGRPDEKDFFIFPGGMPGSRELAGCEPLIDLMKEHYELGGSVAAICAAPGLVLSQLGDALKGHEMTCFDGFEDALKECGARFVARPAVHSGRIVTGRSSGHTIAFALEILRIIKGDEAVSEVEWGMMLKTE
jgi:protein deglycase